MARSQRGSHRPPRWCWTRTGLTEGLLARQPRNMGPSRGPLSRTALGTRHGAVHLRGGLKPGDLAAPARPKSHGGWDGTGQWRGQLAAREASRRRPRQAGAGPPHRTAPARPGGVPPPGSSPGLGREFPRSVNCVLQIKIATSVPLKIALLTQAAQNSVGKSPLAGGPAPRASHWLWRKHGRNAGGQCPTAGGRPQEPCALPLGDKEGTTPGAGACPRGCRAAHSSPGPSFSHVLSSDGLSQPPLCPGSSPWAAFSCEGKLTCKYTRVHAHRATHQLGCFWLQVQNQLKMASRATRHVPGSSVGALVGWMTSQDLGSLLVSAPPSSRGLSPHNSFSLFG